MRRCLECGQQWREEDLICPVCSKTVHVTVDGKRLDEFADRIEENIEAFRRDHFGDLKDAA